MTETINIKEIKVNNAIHIQVDSLLYNDNQIYRQSLKREKNEPTQ